MNRFHNLLSLATVTLLSVVAAQTQDQCAYLNNAPFQITYDVVQRITIGFITTCLCVSDIPSFITTNVVAEAAVAIAGTAQTTSALTSLIENAATTQTCTFPEHASAQCSSSNVCGYSCTDGFTEDSASDACTCEAPNVDCNGVCGDYPSCNSRRSAPNDLEGLLRRDPHVFRREPAKEERDMTPAERRAWKAEQGRRVGQRLGCRDGWEACGVFGGSRNAWECVDTMNDLESCGGCTIPLLAPSTSAPTLDDLLTFGTDCTALPGVADVACVRGECAVLRCERGWTVSAGGRRCRRIRRSGSSKSHHYQLHEILDVHEDGRGSDAEEYGLEHVPLGG